MPARKSSTKATAASKSSTKTSNGNNGAGVHSPDAIAVLQAREAEITKLIDGLQNFTGDEKQLKPLRELFSKWAGTCRMEEDLALEAFREAGVEQSAIDEILIENDLAKILMASLARTSPRNDQFKPILEALKRSIHRQYESKGHKTEGLYAKVRAAGTDLTALAEKFKESARSADTDAEARMELPKPRYLRGGTAMRNKQEYPTMAMRGNDRERDERGRFVDDDRSRRGSQQYRQSSQSSRSGRSRMDDDDNNDGRGWYGDSQGHAEAARRGWDERRSSNRYDDDDRRQSQYRSRSSRDDDDDDRRYSRSRSSYDDDDRRNSQSRSNRDDDDYNSGRGRSQNSNGDRRRTGGWFGDSEGHSEASRRGWENPDHGDSSWYGDREGHREASRRGWDNPDHGPSGWYGDSEGHSEASRRGWDGRRNDDDSDRRRRSRRND